MPTASPRTSDIGITEAGYADVTGLTLDDKGVWQAKAMKDGKSVAVTLDYQGNIMAK